MQLPTRWICICASGDDYRRCTCGAIAAQQAVHTAEASYVSDIEPFEEIIL